MGRYPAMTMSAILIAAMGSGELMMANGGGKSAEQATQVLAASSRPVTGTPQRDELIQALRELARPTAAAPAATTGARGGSSNQISQIRINNNAFTTEGTGGPGGRGGGPGGPGGPGGGGGRGGGRGGIEVIQRGGTGDYHGNFSFNFKDESLNARNAFADNRPAFQQRNINANVSGPFIRNVLTASATFNQTESENGDTVRANTPAGLVSFGIVKPGVSRSYSGNGQMQLSEDHALHFDGRFSKRDNKNQGIGGFTLPERAWVSSNRDWDMGLREIWAVSPRTIHEVRFDHARFSNSADSITRGASINVLDAFRAGGGGENNSLWRSQTTISNLFWYEGDVLTVKAGASVVYHRLTALSEDGFEGQFTFSSLEDYLAGKPVTYRVTQGDPLLDITLTEIGSFLQTDWRASRRFTLSLGVRHDWQSNIKDPNNFNPRLGFAYSLANSTVLRGGAGIFYQRLGGPLFQELRRYDGQRQVEIVVSNPAFTSDPLQSGDVTVVPPTSRRVPAEDLANAYDFRTSISLERTLPWNMTFDTSYQYERGIHQYRTRNLNAPLPGTGQRPFPNEGNILQVESTGLSRSQNWSVGFRQRLSFVTYNASYTLSSGYSDFQSDSALPMDNYNLALDWGRNGNLQKHRYNFNVNTQAPFGSFFTVSMFGNSGSPYNITTGKDNNGDQTTNDRPEGVARNSADGPRFFNVNMNVSKTFRLAGDNRGGPGGGGGQQLSFYANLENALNMTQLRNPSGVITSKFFGIPTSANAARDVEIGLRYQF